MGERRVEGLYVAVPAFGGVRGARRGVSTNKGCARRQQSLPGWGEWEQEVVEVVEVMGAGEGDMRERAWE